MRIGHHAGEGFMKVGIRDTGGLGETTESKPDVNLEKGESEVKRRAIRVEGKEWR